MNDLSSRDRPDAAGSQPPLLYPPYGSTTRRAPMMPLIRVPETLLELNAPVYGWWPVGETDNDLTRQRADEPQGQRIIVAGHVRDEDGRPIPGALVEIWQANAAGRYHHAKDDHPAPLDPNFTGAGRTITDADGRYEFTTIKPGAYPWRNHDNAWRPAHIHLSLFGSSFLTRLVTQMYFPGDPLMPLDPMVQSIRDERARQRLVSRFDLALTRPEWALGFAFDIVVRGREATPFEERT
jgi:protocatechuate 3,4-dioxygenase, beta subunit